MATRQSERRSSSRASGSSSPRKSSGKPSSSRSSSGKSTSKSASAKRSSSSGRAASRSTGKPQTRRSGSSSGRRKAEYKSQGFGGFYKVMTLLAVAGLAAALYFGGYLDNIGAQIKDAGSVGGVLEKVNVLDAFTSSSSTAAPSVETTTAPTDETTTRVTTTSAVTSASTTAATTATKPKVTGTNADYVDSPDYESPYYIVVFTGSQSVVVYGKDSGGAYSVKTKCFTCSTGAPGTATRTGLYSILRTYRWHPLNGGVYGQYCSGFSGSYLFHSILYDDTDPSTLYTNSYYNLGTAASHGCVRLCVRDAKWIYDNCPKGTQVHVVNAEGPEGESYLPEILSGSKYEGWDPTDPDENNPYNKN